MRCGPVIIRQVLIRPFCRHAVQVADMDMPLLPDMDDIPPMPDLALSPDALQPPAEITNIAGAMSPGSDFRFPCSHMQAADSQLIAGHCDTGSKRSGSIHACWHYAGEDVPGTPKSLQKQQEIMPATPQVVVACC